MNTPIFTVYILYSLQYNKIYIGETSDLIQRFRSHNSMGNEWTKRFRPWIVIYCEYYQSRSEAKKREKQLKSGKGREWIWKQIKEELNLKGYLSSRIIGSSICNSKFTNILK